MVMIQIYFTRSLIKDINFSRIIFNSMKDFVISTP